MTMIRGLAEIVLSVHDLDASLRFYRDTLGLTLVSEPKFRPVFLRAGDFEKPLTGAFSSHRDDEPPAGGKLLFQRLRHFRSACGDNDGA